MRIVRIVLMIALSIATPAVADPAIDCAMGRNDCAVFAGKQMWIVNIKPDMIGVEVAKSLGNWSGATRLRAGSLIIIRGVRNPQGRYDLEVRLSDGRKGYIDVMSLAWLSPNDPIVAAKDARDECTRRGQPKIGMTPLELTETCWGKPRRVVKKTTAGGVEESYVYGIGHIVTLRDGKVAEIVEAR